MMQLLYPRLCAHCGSSISSKSSFCIHCHLFFEMAPPQEEKLSCGISVCYVFTYIGAVASFVEGVREGFFTKLAVSFLLVQFERLHWPLPDLLLAMPSRGKRYYGKAFAKKLGVPFCKKIKKRPGRIPQAKLPPETRLFLSSKDFLSTAKVEGKTLLVLDDIVATGSSFKALLPHLYGAKRIYFLALSKQDLPSNLPAPPR